MYHLWQLINQSLAPSKDTNNSLRETTETWQHFWQLPKKYETQLSRKTNIFKSMLLETDYILTFWYTRHNAKELVSQGILEITLLWKMIFSKTWCLKYKVCNHIPLYLLCSLTLWVRKMDYFRTTRFASHHGVSNRWWLYCLFNHLFRHK